MKINWNSIFKILSKMFFLALFAVIYVFMFLWIWIAALANNGVHRLLPEYIESIVPDIYYIFFIQLLFVLIASIYGILAILKFTNIFSFLKDLNPYNIVQSLSSKEKIFHIVYLFMDILFICYIFNISFSCSYTELIPYIIKLAIYCLIYLLQFNFILSVMFYVLGYIPHMERNKAVLWVSHQIITTITSFSIYIAFVIYNLHNNNENYPFNFLLLLYYNKLLIFFILLAVIIYFILLFIMKKISEHKQKKSLTAD